MVIMWPLWPIPPNGVSAWAAQSSVVACSERTRLYQKRVRTVSDTTAGMVPSAQLLQKYRKPVRIWLGQICQPEWVILLIIRNLYSITYIFSFTISKVRICVRWRRFSCSRIVNIARSLTLLFSWISMMHLNRKTSDLCHLMFREKTHRVSLGRLDWQIWVHVFSSISYKIRVRNLPSTSGRSDVFDVSGTWRPTTIWTIMS